jgi:hypothetical protein
MYFLNKKLLPKDELEWLEFLHFIHVISSATLSEVSRGFFHSLLPNIQVVPYSRPQSLQHISQFIARSHPLIQISAAEKASLMKLRNKDDTRMRSASQLAVDYIELKFLDCMYLSSTVGELSIQSKNGLHFIQPCVQNEGRQTITGDCLCIRSLLVESLSLLG